MINNADDELARKRSEKHRERMEKEIRQKIQTLSECALIMTKGFLTAWKRGISKLGSQYFELKCPVIEIINKWQACPKTLFILEIATRISHGQAALLGLMCSFYNSEDGQKILENVSLPNFVDALAILDDEGQEIISELMRYYTGW